MNKVCNFLKLIILIGFSFSVIQWELLGSPWGSINELSMEEPSYQTHAETSTLSADVRSSTGSLNDTRNEISDSSQYFADPLSNTTQTSDTASLLDATIDENETNVEMIWYEGQSYSFPVLSAAVITRRFLLSSTRGYDDSSRISHKFMAFRCLIAIFDSNPFVATNINEIAGSPKVWSELFDFISHSDDKLSTASFEFYIVFQNALQLRGQSTEFCMPSCKIHDVTVNF